MPRQFTPDDRETVKDSVTSIDDVFAATECGIGLYVVYESIKDHTRNFTPLVERHGWYVDKYEESEAGAKAVFMPITEVPE